MVQKSTAADRNKKPILDAIAPHIKQFHTILEIGSGAGEHLNYFASYFPETTFIPSEMDLTKYQCNRPLTNIAEPLYLDMCMQAWWSGLVDINIDCMLTINTFHIMPWQGVKNFFNGCSQLMPDTILVYGPVKVNHQYTKESDLIFDQNLRRYNPESGLRNVETIMYLAENNHYRLNQFISMPANNKLMLFKLKN